MYFLSLPLLPDAIRRRAQTRMAMMPGHPGTICWARCSGHSRRSQESPQCEGQTGKRRNLIINSLVVVKSLVFRR